MNQKKPGTKEELTAEMIEAQNLHTQLGIEQKDMVELIADARIPGTRRRLARELIDITIRRGAVDTYISWIGSCIRHEEHNNYE